MAATRKLIRTSPLFDDLGALVSFSAVCRILTDDAYRDQEGNAVTVMQEIRYTVQRADLPPQFVTDQEAEYAKVVLWLDANFPMPV